MHLHSSTKRGLVLFAIAASLIGVATWWRRPVNPGSTETPSPDAKEAVHPSAHTANEKPGLADAAPTKAQSGAKDFVVTPAIPAIEGEAPMIPSLVLQRGELAWEKQLRAILDDAAKTDTEKAGALLAQLTVIPAEGRETAAEEAVKRVTNADYRVVQPHVTSAGTYGLALGVLFADLMERPDDLRLPTLLTIARNPQHPFAESARDNLNLLLRVQHGTDWTQWDAAIRARLAGAR